MPSVSSSPKDRDPNIPTSQCIEILKAPSKWYMCFRNKLIIWQIRTLDKRGQITVTSKCIHINSQYLSDYKNKNKTGGTPFTWNKTDPCMSCRATLRQQVYDAVGPSAFPDDGFLGLCIFNVVSSSGTQRVEKMYGEVGPWDGKWLSMMNPRYRICLGQMMTCLLHPCSMKW